MKIPHLHGARRNIYQTIVLGVSLMLMLTQVLATPVSALSQPDLEAIHNWPLWVPELPCGASGSTGTTTLTGSDPEDKIWNFLLGQGLSKAQAAGVMGNIQQESGFNPGAHQTAGAWSDTGTGYNQAVGLMQWDGGNRPALIKAAKAAGLSLSDLESGSDKNLSFQLQYMLKQMQGTSPTGVKDMIAGLKKITDAGQAATYFNKNFESGSDPGNVRENNATKIFTNPNFGGGSASTTTASTSSTSGGACPATLTGAVNCTSGSGNVTGNAKILCEAERFDPASYSESATGNHMGSNKTWISKVCPAAGQSNGKITPSCYVDCSGLVNIAVYLAFGYDLSENTDGERAAEGKLWKVIHFNQLQAGDLIQPNQGHVEIVERVQGNTIYTFGAHTSQRPQPYQVGDLDAAGVPVTFQNVSSNLYLQWIGPTGGTTVL